MSNVQFRLKAPKSLQKLLGLCLTLVAKTAARGTKDPLIVRKRLFFRLSVAVATTQKM